MSDRSVLIVTLPPGLGGVTAQSRLAVDLLRRRGYHVDLAWRASYRDFPELSVPLWHAWHRRPALRSAAAGEGTEHTVGTWLPEFEWAHHQAWRPWRELLERYSRHVVVSGNVLPGWGLHALGLPALHWIASPYGPDRQTRVAAWPLWRQFYDRALNARIGERQERALIGSADVWAISRYTLERLRALAPRNKVHGIVVIPVDIARFHPGDRFAWLRSAGPVRLGVSGRLSDPRKGLPLLLDAFRRLVRSGANAVLQIRGDVSTDDIRHGFDLGDIGDRLDVAPAVPASGLPDFLRGLDVFVLPSHQEGLSQIAAEAMACGCCVVSTRCGGPEEFVLDGETGLLADIEPGALAHRLEAAVADADLRQTLGQAGAAYIRERYAPPIFEQQFVEAFASVYPDA